MRKVGMRWRYRLRTRGGSESTHTTASSGPPETTWVAPSPTGSGAGGTRTRPRITPARISVAITNSMINEQKPRAILFAVHGSRHVGRLAGVLVGVRHGLLSAMGRNGLSQKA